MKGTSSLVGGLKTSLNLALALAGIGILLYGLHTLNQAQLANARSQDLSSAKDLAQAVHSYAGDSNDHLPLAASWKSALRSYFPYEPAFATKEVNPFAFHSRLSAVPISRIQEPDRTAMICPIGVPPSQWERNDYTVVAFVDGHVSVFHKENAEALDQVVWQPKLAPEG